MRSIQLRRAPVGVAIAVLLVAACGGGGGGDGPPVVNDPNIAGTDVPTSATTSSAGAFAFVKATASTKPETSEPLTVGNATLATSDTDEPDPGV